MTTPSLIDWLRTALDEDERLAREATPGPWVREWAFSTHFVCPAGDAPVASSNVSRLKPNQRADAEHIANWDPARVLAEVQSKRTLIDIILQHAAKIDGEWGCCHEPESIALGHCPETSVDEIPGLRALAQPYRSRPGFREEWLT